MKILFCILLLSSCITDNKFHGNKDKIFSNAPLVLTHRGDTLVYPESTISAFKAALENGANMLEMDLQLTKDKIIVVSHDNNLKRLSGLDLNIDDLELEELKKINIAKFFNDKHQTNFQMQISELKHVFEEFPHTPMSLEIKPFFGDELAEKLFELIEKTGNHDQLLVASFYAGNLKHFRTISNGRILTSAGTEEVINFQWKTYWFPNTKFDWPFQVLQLPKQADPDWFFAPFNDSNFVQKAKKQDLKVLIFGINNEQQLQQAQTAKLDGIISDNLPIAKKFIPTK